MQEVVGGDWRYIAISLIIRYLFTSRVAACQETGSREAGVIKLTYNAQLIVLEVPVTRTERRLLAHVMWSFVPASGIVPPRSTSSPDPHQPGLQEIPRIPAPYGVTCPQAAGNRPCQMFERDVASRMSVGIIDQFELVYVR